MIRNRQSASLLSVQCQHQQQIFQKWTTKKLSILICLDLRHVHAIRELQIETDSLFLALPRKSIFTLFPGRIWWKKNPSCANFLRGWRTCETGEIEDSSIPPGSLSQFTSIGSLSTSTEAFERFATSYFEGTNFVSLRPNLTLLLKRCHLSRGTRLFFLPPRKGKSPRKATWALNFSFVLASNTFRETAFEDTIYFDLLTLGQLHSQVLAHILSGKGPSVVLSRLNAEGSFFLLLLAGYNFETGLGDSDEASKLFWTKFSWGLLMQRRDKLCSKQKFSKDCGGINFKQARFCGRFFIFEL